MPPSLETSEEGRREGREKGRRGREGEGGRSKRMGRASLLVLKLLSRDL